MVETNKHSVTVSNKYELNRNLLVHQKGSSGLVASHHLKSINKMNPNPIGYFEKYLYGRVAFCVRFFFSWCRVRSTLLGITLLD